MCSSISTVSNVLIPAIRNLNKSTNFVKREVLPRLLAVTTIFLRTIDAFSNLGLATIKLGGKLLEKCGVKAISAEAVSSEVIYAHLNGIREAIFGKPFLGVKLIFNPKSTPFESCKSRTQHIFHQAIAEKNLRELSSEELDKNWKLNEYFGHIYVINLDDRPNAADPQKHKQRFDRVVSDLNKVGCTTFERLRATYGAHELDESIWKRVSDNSWGRSVGEELKRQHMNQAGCFMSHYRAIKNANENYVKAEALLKSSQYLLENSQTDDEKRIAQNSIKAAEKRIKEYSSILILEDDNGFGRLTKRYTDLQKELAIAKANNKNAKSPLEKTNTALALAAISDQIKNELGDNLQISEDRIISKEGAGTEFRKAMQELPNDWGMFYFTAVECGEGGRRWLKAQSKDLSPHLNQLKYGLLANAIAINSNSYEEILHELSRIEQPGQSYRPVDHEYALLHTRGVKAYVPKQPLAFQGAGASSITDGEGGPWDGTWERGY